MPTFHAAKADEIEHGCPPGKTVLWVVTMQRFLFINREVILSGYLFYDILDEALADMARQLDFFGGQEVIVNHKSEDGLRLVCWTLKKNTRTLQGKTKE